MSETRESKDREKKCPKCGNIKQILGFAQNKTRKDRLAIWCKECNKFYYIRKRAKLLAQKQEDYAKHPEIYAERNRKFFENNYKRKMVDAAKRRAKAKNLPFNLTYSDIVLPEKCPVLGIPLQFNKQFSKFDSFSLDKIVPEKGYVKDNIVVISLKANQIKNCSTIAELEMVYRFFSNLSGAI